MNNNGCLCNILLGGRLESGTALTRVFIKFILFRYHFTTALTLTIFKNITEWLLLANSSRTEASVHYYSVKSCYSDFEKILNKKSESVMFIKLSALKVNVTKAVFLGTFRKIK